MNFQLPYFFTRFGSWLALMVGALLALAFAPFDIWPLAILCPAYLFLAWQDATPRRAAVLGFWFNAGTFGAGTYWLYHSIHTIGGAPIWLALFLMLALVAIMGVYLALLGYAQARLLPKSGALRWLVGLPAMWVLLEWWRGWFLSGFPWLSLGYAQINSPLAGLAPIIGVYGISLACALCAGAFIALVHGTRSQRLAAVIGLIAPWLIAWPMWKHEWTQANAQPVSVAIVQGAIPQNEKWSKEWSEFILMRYRELTEQHLGQRLIVWPEAALPDYAHYYTDYLSGLWSAAHARGSDLILGALHYEAKDDTSYNAVLALSDKVEWYHKRHLVPYAEFFPVPSFVREWLKLMSLPNGDFNAGRADQPALDAAGQRVGLTICYEDGFGSEQLAVLRQATLLVNVTNDAWFGDTSAPHQHLEISRMRALEAGRDMIRAANDGISAIIDSRGMVKARLPRFKAAVLTGDVQPRTGLTPYARVGNWPVIVLSLICALAVSIDRWRRARGEAKGRRPSL